MAGERDQAYLPACLAYGGKALSIVVARQKSSSFPLIVIKKSVLEWPGGNLAKLSRGGGRGSHISYKLRILEKCLDEALKRVKN